MSTLVRRERFTYPDSAFYEVLIWHVAPPVRGSSHAFKYRLVYIVGGVRVIGYDNERDKGDHRHAHGVETPYAFISLPELMAAFRRDVDQERSP
jgi:hypothetical protein